MESDGESGERTPTEKEPLTGYTHVYAAISAIVNEDLEFFTPPELIDAREASLSNVEEEEGGESLPYYSLTPAGMPSIPNQPMSINQPQSIQPGFANYVPSTVNQPLTISARPPVLDSLRQKQLSRSISTQARHWSTSSIRSPTYAQPQSLSLTRSLSVQPQGRVFGSNRFHVERILQRMADAIRMDLNLK